MSAAAGSRDPGHPVHALVPRPLAASAWEGHVELPEGALVRADPALRAAARTWRRTCEDVYGVAWDLRTTGPGASRPLVGTGFALDPDLPAGGYTIRAQPGAERVDVVCADPAGAHAAVATLRQLLGPTAYRRAGTGVVRVPCGEVVDAPRYPWRGVMLDVARHFLPKDAVMRFVELAAEHKLNVVQLHLSDDQGWRFEVRRHPRLTQVGGWRASSGVGTWRAGRTDSTPHGGWYTQEDLREIVAHAGALGVSVVPEINVPGHSQAAVAAYPHLGTTGTDPGVRSAWGISEEVLRPTEETLDFYRGVLDELVDVFPSPVVCLGGDEVPTTRWAQDPALVRQAHDLGLAGTGDLHGWFVARLAEHLASHGRRASVWDEAMSDLLPADAVVCSWRGIAQGARALTQGRDVVMSPEQWVYLDHRAAEGADEPVPVGFVRTVDDVYSFDPEPPPVHQALGKAGHGHLLGAQATLWSEHLDSPRRVDYAAFPRLAAFAEAVWTAPDRRDAQDFRRRLADHHVPRLLARGVELRPEAGPEPWQQRPGVPGWPRDLAAEQAAGGWEGVGGWRPADEHEAIG